MPGYLDYLDMARSAERSSEVLIQTQEGILRLIQAYTARPYLLWGAREFAAELHIFTLPPVNLQTLITHLATLAVSADRATRTQANGDFEQLLTAVYAYVKSKSLPEIDLRGLDEIQVSIIMGRDWSLLSCKLSDLVNPQLPRKKYEFYRLHGLSLAAIRSPYHKATAILSAYARPWVWRSYHRQINNLIREHTELDPLINALATWIESAEFSGFTTDGDFEHMMAGLYLVLEGAARTRLDGIRITLESLTAQALIEHFPTPPLADPASPAAAARAVSQTSATTTTTTVGTGAIISPRGAGAGAGAGAGVGVGVGLDFRSPPPSRASSALEGGADSPIVGATTTPSA